MNVEMKFTEIKIPIELMQVCGAYAACVYAVIRFKASDGKVTISNSEIGKLTGIPARSIPNIVEKLVTLGLIQKKCTSGYITEYTIKQDTIEENPAKKEVQEPEPVKKVKRSNGYQVPYFVMLDNIGSDLASDRPRSEDDIKGYDRNTEECTIPEEWALSNYPAMVEDALKYISYYAEIKKTEYKKFVGEVITCLSEAICNGMRSNAKSVEPTLIIRRINEIIHDENYSFGQWLHDFGVKYDEYLRGHAETIYNKHNFLKTCAVNYLTEHRAGVMPEFTEVDNNYGMEF